MREIVIDLSQNNVSCPPFFGGYEGEHKNTKLSIVLPPELLPANIDQAVQYKFLFQTSIGELIPSPYITTEEITDDTISIILWGQLLKHRGILIGCVVAVSDSGEEVELIAKTPSFKLKIGDSPTGVDVIVDTTENRDFISEIAESYLIAHMKTPYDIAVDNGFEGTEKEWLESLKGEDGQQGIQGIPGDDGKDGLSAYEVAVKHGFEGTEEEWLKSLKGETGAGLGLDSITENLLGVENLSKWTVIRESETKETDTPYSHYAGVVGLSNEGLEGVTGMLTQLQTNSFTTAWTDFKYSEKVSLGDSFSIKLTPFIKNGEAQGKQIYEDSFVDIKFGSWSIRLFRWARDQYQDYKGWPANTGISPSGFYKLRVGLCLDLYHPETGELIQEGALTAYSDVITSTTNNLPTTNICGGSPTATGLGSYNSNLMKYIRSFCVATNDLTLEELETTCFTTKYGYKDITLTFDKGVLQILDANGNPLNFSYAQYNEDYTIANEISLGSSLDFSQLASMGIPYPETNNLDIKVRLYHDRLVALYHPLALMRFEITKNNPPDAIEDVNNTSDEAVKQASEVVRRLDSGTSDLYEIADALMIDFENPNSAINTRSWSVTWRTANVPPYGVQGIRNPVVNINNTFVAVDETTSTPKSKWMVSITETSPNFGRQWFNIYTKEEGWSGWRSVESISSHLPISKGGTGFGTAEEARVNLGAASIEEMTDVSNRVKALESYFNSDSWESVQKIVQSGLAPQMFPIGYQFTIHHDEYGDMLYDVVAHDYLKSAEDENAHTMTLLSHNIVLNAQYDNCEAYGGGLNYVFKTIPTTIPAGTVCAFYYDEDIDNYGWYFTVDVEIPAGSYATYYPAEYSGRAYVLIYSDETATNLIYSSEGKQSQFNLEQPTFEGFTFTEIDAGKSTFKIINDDMRKNEGSNNYKESAIRQFLNSSATAGNWWHPQTNVDLPPNHTNKNGFLYGLDSEFLNVVGTVNLPCAANNTYEHPDSEVTVGSSYILQDRFYLPSITEIVGINRIPDTVVADGSTVLSYYKNQVDNVAFSAKYTKEGVSSTYCTRTPGANYSFLIMHITSTGGATMNTAAQQYGIVPMCTIV